MHSFPDQDTVVNHPLSLTTIGKIYCYQIKNNQNRPLTYSNYFKLNSAVFYTTSHIVSQIAEGEYMGTVTLSRKLDYEMWSSYRLVLQASDSSSRPLTATANVVIDVIDVQDQAPVFVGAPYSATVQENTPPVSTRNLYFSRFLSIVAIFSSLALFFTLCVHATCVFDTFNILGNL